MFLPNFGCALLLAAAVAFGSPNYVHGAELRRGPYLQAQRSDGISIRWRTDASVHHSSVVRYGEHFNRLDKVVQANEVSLHYPGVRDWQVTMNGLKPDTKYYYALEADRATLCGADERHYFRTAPERGAERAMRFLLLGDAGSNRPRDDNKEAVLTATAPMDPILVRNGFREFNKGRAFDGIILLGDNAYPLGTDEMYQAALFNVYQDELRSVPLWPCTGNHDLDDAYPHLFTVNDDGNGGGVASRSRLYYSVDLANMHLVVLDPWISWWRENTDTNHQPWVRQREWLEKDLREARNKWIVVANHFPLYCDGNYGSDDGPLATLRAEILPLIDRYSVDLFVAGHDHTYQRSFLIAGHDGPAATFNAEEHLKWLDDGRDKPIKKHPVSGCGTVHIVSGTAGGYRPQGRFQHPAMVPFETPEGMRRGLAVPGCLVIEVDGALLRGWQVGVSGEVLDRFSIQHEGRRAFAAEGKE